MRHIGRTSLKCTLHSRALLLEVTSKNLACICRTHMSSLAAHGVAMFLYTESMHSEHDMVLHSHTLTYTQYTHAMRPKNGHRGHECQWAHSSDAPHGSDTSHAEHINGKDSASANILMHMTSNMRHTAHKVHTGLSLLTKYRLLL
jgi:hypothetical protein